MRRVPSILPALVLALLLGGGVWVVVRDGGGSGNARERGDPAEPRATASPTADADVPDASHAKQTDAPPTRPTDELPAALRGIVVDGSGAPIAGARVEVHPEDASHTPSSVATIVDEVSPAPPYGTVITAENGEFEIPGALLASLPDPPPLVLLHATAPGFQVGRESGWTPPIDLVDESQERVTITLERAWTITGVLVDLHGAPVADLPLSLTVIPHLDADADGVEIHRNAELLRPIAATRSGSDGRFTFEGLPPGHSVIRSVDENWSLSTGSGPWHLDPALAPTTWDAGAVLVLAPRDLSVRLRDAVSGAVLEDGAVQVASHRALFGAVMERDSPPPDAEGWRRFGEIPAWIRSLRASAPGYFSETIAFDEQPGATVTLEIELTPGARILGRSVDRSGTPVVGASVFIGLAGSPPEQRFARTTTDENGAFLIDPQQAGTFDLAIDARTVLPVVVRGIELHTGQTLDLGTIRHDSGARLSGRLGFERGGAPGWAYVRINGRTSEGVSFSRRTDYEKEGYRFDGLPPGTYQLSIGYPDAEDRSGRFESEEFTITGEEHRTLDVTLPGP